MARILVLGCGLVGGWVATTLANDGHDVVAIDASAVALDNLGPHVTRVLGPASAASADEHDPDVVVNTLPGRLGHGVRTGLLERGINVADLAFTAEDPGTLDGLAQRHGATLLWDVGVAPGMSNLLLAEGVRRHGRLRSGRVRVGGNPVEPDDGWSYMAPFSPYDVLEEYTRPARIVRGGRTVEVPALSERVPFEMEGRGTMEAFLTDGLRSVLETVPAEALIEATVRWPGHIDRYLAHRHALDEDELVQAWAWREDRAEFTWMEVVCEGEDGARSRWVLDDVGRSDGSSMARTTGAVTCAAVDHLLAGGSSTGVHPPERAGEGFLQRCLNRYERYGIALRET